MTFNMTREGQLLYRDGSEEPVFINAFHHGIFCLFFQDSLKALLISTDAVLFSDAWVKRLGLM